MKKLLIAAPALALLTACTTTNVAQPTPSQIQAVQANSTTYRCDNDTEVVSLYSERDARNGYANVKITSPMLSLNQAALVLKRGNVGEAGTNYSAASRTTSYDWQVLGSQAALTVGNNGKSYSFVCRAI